MGAESLLASGRSCGLRSAKTRTPNVSLIGIRSRPHSSPGSETILSNELQVRITRRPKGTRGLVVLQAGPDIKLITSDVDGTLLDSQQRLSPKVEKAVKLSRSVGVPLVVATGKAPGGAWIERTIPRLGPAPQPGIFMQGAVVIGPEGNVIYTRELPRHIIETVVAFGKEHGVQITAYCTDRILAEKTDEQSDRLKFYAEPTPESVGPLLEYTADKPVQKMLVMADKAVTDKLRPHLQEALGGDAEITVAIQGMLEVLPLSLSKYIGVTKLLEVLGLTNNNLMALGDGENDIDMLKNAAIGVHVANAVELARQAADVGTTSNDEDGVALAIEEHILKPRGLSLDSEI